MSKNESALTYSHKTNLYFGRDSETFRLISVTPERVGEEIVENFNDLVRQYGSRPLLRQINACWELAEAKVKHVDYWKN